MKHLWNILESEFAMNWLRVHLRCDPHVMIVTLCRLFMELWSRQLAFPKESLVLIILHMLKLVETQQLRFKLPTKRAIWGALFVTFSLRDRSHSKKIGVNALEFYVHDQETYCGNRKVLIKSSKIDKSRALLHEYRLSFTLDLCFSIIKVMIIIVSFFIIKILMWT